MDLLLLIHAGATLYMVGLIWFVQVVHYPLFAAVGAPDYGTYQQAHMRRTTFVVLPPMVVELTTAAMLALPPLRPAAVPSFAGGAGLIAVLLVWAVTFLVSVPAHRRLSSGFDQRAHARLVASNWLRTALWSLRGGLALWMLHISSTPDLP